MANGWPKTPRGSPPTGRVDETNSAIGMARIHLGGGHQVSMPKLERIQNDLFDLGATYAFRTAGSLSPV